MTGAASGTTVVDACPFFINARLRMRKSIARRAPNRCVVAILAGRSKCAQVESRVSMAGYTLRGKPLEGIIDMALLTGYIHMLTVQRKVAAVVIERSGFPAIG